MSTHWACYGTGVAHDERLGCRHADHGPCGGRCPRCDECDGTGKVDRVAVRYTLDSERAMPAGSVLAAHVNSVQIDTDGALHIAIQVDGVASPIERRAMKIVKRGTPPTEIEQEIDCHKCGSVLRFMPSEVRKTKVGDSRDLYEYEWRFVNCCVCAAKLGVDKARPVASGEEGKTR